MYYRFLILYHSLFEPPLLFVGIPSAIPIPQTISHLPRVNMMKIHTALAVVAVALFCFTDAVDAQGGGRGGRGGRGGGPGGQIGASQLLGVEAVQQELQITSEQLEALGGLIGNRRGGGGRGQGGAGGGGRGQGGAGGGGRGQGGGRGAGGARGAEMEAQLAEILNEAQIKRLSEIRVNVLGANALTDSKVAEAVGLTEADLQKIEEARSNAFAEMRQNMMSGGGGDRSAMMEKIQEMRASVDKSIMEMLTEEQAARFQTLKGEPFELDMRELMMGGRGGRGGQGGPGGRPGGGGAGGRPGGGGGPSGRPGQ